MLRFAWAVGILFFISVLSIKELTQYDIQDIYKRVIIPGTVLFILSAFASNMYLLLKLNNSIIPPYNEATAVHAKQPSFLKVLFKSQFVIPILVSFLFALFLSSACLESYLRHEEQVHLNFLTFMLFNSMILTDSIIYLGFEPRIRMLIKKWLRDWREQRNLNRQMNPRGENCEDNKQLPGKSTDKADCITTRL